MDPSVIPQVADQAEFSAALRALVRPLPSTYPLILPASGHRRKSCSTGLSVAWYLVLNGRKFTVSTESNVKTRLKLKISGG